MGLRVVGTAVPPAVVPVTPSDQDKYSEEGGRGWIEYFGVNLQEGREVVFMREEVGLEMIKGTGEE